MTFLVVIGLSVGAAATGLGDWLLQRGHSPSGFDSSKATPPESETATEAAPQNTSIDTLPASSGLTSAQEQYVQRSLQSVRDSLREPGSAQFRNTYAVRFDVAGQAGVGVCGEVNARNGFGGYGDYDTFYAVGHEVGFASNDADFAKIYGVVCGAPTYSEQIY